MQRELATHIVFKGNNHIGPEGATEIAQVLTSNTSITKVGLGIYIQQTRIHNLYFVYIEGNDIGPEGSVLIARSLTSNTVITEVNLGITYIETIILCNKSSATNISFIYSE